MPQPLNKLWASPLGSLPEYFFDELARRTAQLRVPNLMASDEAAVNCLSESLADESLFHRAGLDQVKNRPQRTSKLETLRPLYVPLRQVGIMKYQDTGNFAVSPEIRGNGHVELRRTQV